MHDTLIVHPRTHRRTTNSTIILIVTIIIIIIILTIYVLYASAVLIDKKFEVQGFVSEVQGYVK